MRSILIQALSGLLFLLKFLINSWARRMLPCPSLSLRAGEWSSLQRDLLVLILEKLDLVDHARFASVCSSWRSVANNNPAINKPLYFALSHDPVNLLRRFITSFVVPSWKEAKFIGALEAWLVIFVDRKDLFLLNKGFNSIIPLPPLPYSMISYFLDGPVKAVLSSPPSSPSSFECTVVVNFGHGGMLYCRLGSDKSFAKLSDCPKWPQDILFYKGQLYVLLDHYTIIIFDHLLNKVSQPQLVTDFFNAPYPKRLLISRNNILTIIAGRPGDQYSMFTLEGREPRLVPMNNIGDNFQILLINNCCSLSVTSTKEHKEFRRATNYYFEKDFLTFVLDTNKDPNLAKADDPWPLFFVMFSSYIIMKEVKSTNHN